MRITLVEDHESLAKGIAYRLGDLGHAVDILADGQAADDLLRGDGGFCREPIMHWCESNRGEFLWGLA